MRCVSYTRTTSCKSSESIPTDIIRQQNEQIQKYIQSHGWKLVAKYSDRKRDDNENTAFEEMTMDGISRKFDMVVVNSIDRCGKYISCAEDVLAKTFFPAGIHFSVVQDDFCSIEKSREEIDEYFRKEKIAVQIKSMREFAVREQIEGYYNVHDEKYGYILSEDRKELLVEEEAATIVREVFQMLLDGVSVKKIADIMNERGVESPMVHNARVGHKHWPHYENKWSEAIQSEMDMAERMTRYLETEAIQKLLQKEQQQYSEKAWMIFQEMEQVEKDRIPIYEKFKNNELTEPEYLDKKEEIQSQLQMYEMDFEGLMERFAEMKKAFSNENEWIKTFQRVELSEDLEFEHVKKWVDKIIVSNFKEVHVYLTMQRWRDYFPEEWLEE